MYKRRFWLVAAILAAFLWAVPLAAQTETGQITGTVLDPTGAAVPNAKVTLKSTTTGYSRTALTSESGVYVFPNLLPGTYELTVQASGFSVMWQQATLPIGTRLRVDFRLEVGQTQTIVEVTETASLVSTATQTLGQVVTTRQVLDLPTATRNPYNFVVTAGNVSEDDPSGRGAGVAINGLRAASTNILLDGAANNDEFTATIGQQVPVDAVQEYSILTNNFTAEFGRAAGGIVNVATKSGTNAFHGTLYEFNRISRLASNSFDSNANGINKPVFTRNQWGYSIGGPVKKDKLFFFQNTEWLRIRSAATRFVWVPTPELIAGSAPPTKNFFSSYGQLRPNLIKLQTFSRSDLVARGFDPCARATVGGPCESLSQSLPLFTRYSYNVPSDSGGGPPENAYYLVGRVDYNFTEKTQLYGRYAFQNEVQQLGVVSNSPYQGFDSGNSQKNASVLVSVVHIFSPSWITQSKVDFNRFNNLEPLGERPVVPTLYFLPTTTTSFLGTSVALPGYLPYTPGNGIPFGGPQNFLQFYEDVSHTRGTHQFRFGGSYTYLRDNRTFGVYQEAVESLGTRFGAGMDNFLRGELNRFQAAVDPQGKYPCGTTVTADCTVTLPVGPPSFSRSNRYNEFALYVQDSWKIRPRLTLNLGLRWEYFGVQHNKNPKLDSNYYDAGSGSIFQQVRNGNVFIAPSSPRGVLWGKDLNNFAPRLGFAWDVFGDGKTSLRGGYGIGYERNFGNVTFNVIQNPPNYAVIALQAGIDLPVIPISTDNAGPLAGSKGSTALPPVSLRNVKDDIRTAYAHFWSASIEREVMKNLFAALEYSGSKGVNLYSIENVNMAGAGNVFLGDPCAKGSSPGDPGTCTARLRTTQYTNINRRGNGGFSNYNALNVRVEIRNVRSSGLTLRFNHIWSHAIDNLSSTFSENSNNANLGLLDPFSPRLDRGDAEFDNRHRLAVSGVWDIPAGRNSNGLRRQLLSGWQLAPILTARTGSPFSLFDASNVYAWAVPRAMFNGSIPRSGPDSPPPASTPNSFKYIIIPRDKVDSSFVNPITNTSEFGPFPRKMSGRNAFRGPGAWNLDLGAYKRFRITERQSLQCRFEAYNVFNHANLGIVGSDNDVSIIEFVSAKRSGRRNVQLALKYIF